VKSAGYVALLSARRTLAALYIFAVFISSRSPNSNWHPWKQSVLTVSPVMTGQSAHFVFRMPLFRYLCPDRRRGAAASRFTVPGLAGVWAVDVLRPLNILEAHDPGLAAIIAISFIRPRHVEHGPAVGALLGRNPSHSGSIISVRYALGYQLSSVHGRRKPSHPEMRA